MCCAFFSEQLIGMSHNVKKRNLKPNLFGMIFLLLFALTFFSITMLCPFVCFTACLFVCLLFFVVCQHEYIAQSMNLVHHRSCICCKEKRCILKSILFYMYTILSQIILHGYTTTMKKGMLYIVMWSFEGLCFSCF